MQQIQNAIADCGWAEAGKKMQQDASEAFSYIAETLEMPLLTLKMDIAHGGLDMADDDHKFINERLLNVAIPEDVEGQITLEKCLEEYFNNRVDVQRKLDQRNFIPMDSSLMDEKPTGGIQLEYADLGSAPSTPISPSPLSASTRTNSILRTRVSKDSHVLHGMPKPRRRASSSLRKEITIPAWQFFNLLPFYTDCNTSSSSSDPSTTKSSFANHFSSKRPIIGLCLKRYNWKSATTSAERKGVQVKIPTEIELPHFVGDDDMDDSGNFRLLLQSAVCHRGTTVNAGHYIALVRTEGDRWLLFDDLAKERVVEVDRAKAFAEEVPYLLFYQVQALEVPPPYEEVDSSRSSTEDSRNLPTFDINGIADGQDSQTSSSASSPSVEAETGDYLNIKGRDSLDLNTISTSLRPSSRSEQRVEEKKPASRSASRTTENRLSFVGLSRLASRKNKEHESTTTTGHTSSTSSVDDKNSDQEADKSAKKKAKRRSRSRKKHHSDEAGDDDKECILQ